MNIQTERSYAKDECIHPCIKTYLLYLLLVYYARAEEKDLKSKLDKLYSFGMVSIPT